MPPAIRVENLSKRYRIRHGDGAAYRTLRDEIMHAAFAPLRWLRGERTGSTEEFWALRDVSFDVQPGEVVGVIGRNGAGKSTLLKILSRITRPTSGRVEMRGRVGSLLEVGTGFHPELTGRENIFLSGAILGMKRAEIARKFDEIVAFAEIERFLDTPVKRYSSGMYVRLAFSVAAHLEPDILIIDEVLAVGDAAFQKKCLNRMSEVGKRGVSVLFVSHNMQHVQRMCGKALLLEKGSLAGFDGAHDVVRRYQSTAGIGPAERIWDGATWREDAEVKLIAARVLDANGKVSPIVPIDEPCYIEITYWKRDESQRTNAAINLFNQDGLLLIGSADFATRATENNIVTVCCEFPGHLLAEGVYSVLVAVVRYNPDGVYARERDAIHFTVVDNTNGEGARGDYRGSNWPGVVRPRLTWRESSTPTSDQSTAGSQEVGATRCLQASE